MPFDIDARLAEWRKSLLDTTKRNRLIKFVAGRIGGVNLVRPPRGGPVDAPRSRRRDAHVPLEA